ncbi:hypothetical protein VTO42DRAFT_2612 [Malbranchea cinnamomea]
MAHIAASPPIYDEDLIPIPENPETGRNNNQGFEALTISPDGKRLRNPRFIHEYVVTLPTYVNPTEEDPDKAKQVASQSEIHYLPTGDFLILARDSGFGHAQPDSKSVCHQVDIISKSWWTTDIKFEKYDKADGSIASSEGELKPGIQPMDHCPSIDFNIPSELGKFGLHNGGDQDKFLLNEKWESLALVPVDPKDRVAKGKKEYFLISFSDNDYITQDGEWTHP